MSIALTVLKTTIEILTNHGSFVFKQAEKLRTDDNSIAKRECLARLAFLAQIIVSAVMIPFGILAMIVTPFLMFCIEDEGTPLDVLKFAFLATTAHVATIPTALIAACVPHSLEWNQPLTGVITHLGPCLGFVS